MKAYADPLTNAMVEFFLLTQVSPCSIQLTNTFDVQSKEQFTVDQQPHYVYSPREMTRWVNSIVVSFENEHNYRLSIGTRHQRSYSSCSKFNSRRISSTMGA
jgi:hypothetical protein